MPAARLILSTIAALAILAACSKSSPGTSEPPVAANGAPTMQVPPELSGTGGNYSLTLPVGNTASLTFTATDPDGDSLRWQTIGATANPVTVGMTLPTPNLGSSYTVEVAAITAPATMSLVLIVEDSRGNATAIDLMIIRTGAPTITAVAPNSAFAASPQLVTITGSALSLGGTATTVARFNGLLGTFATIESETTLRCTTPAGMTAGPTVVSVDNAYGTTSLPASAFTAYAFPPVFEAGGQQLDAGNGRSAAIVRDGEQVHAAWIEGGMIVHRASADSGASWSAIRILSGGEVPTEPQVTVIGQKATVAWLGDGMTVLAATTIDGGATFASTRVLNSASTQPVRRPRISASGDHRYVAWLAGNTSLGLSRLFAATSVDAGGTWGTATLVSDGGANQAAHSIASHGATAWVAFTDERQGGGALGAYTARTVDGGTSWSAANLRSMPATSASEPRLCADVTDGTDVHVTWLQGGGLRYAGSTNAGGAWAPPVELRDASAGAVSSPSITCQGNRVFACYVVGGYSVWVSGITATGAAPKHVELQNNGVTVGVPRIEHRGNYVFAAWRSDSVLSGAARIRHAISRDIGQTFSTPAGSGDGAAAQDEPLLAVDGAKMLLCWLDYRGASAALFTNRNRP